MIRLQYAWLCCSDSQAALKALQAARTTSPFVRQCQEALNDIHAWHMMELCWVPGHAGVQGNEIADGLARSGSALRFLGPEPVLGVSRPVIRTKFNQWLINQHWASWRDLGHTQRQAWELSQDLVRVSRPNFCPSTGLSPGLWLAFLLDTTPWEDTFTCWGW